MKSKEEKRLYDLFDYRLSWAKNELAEIPKVNDGTERAYFNGVVLGLGLGKKILKDNIDQFYTAQEVKEIIGKVLIDVARQATLRTYTAGSMLDEHYEVDKQSILNIDINKYLK